MNTAKHSKKWSLPLSRKKPFFARSKHVSAYISTVLFASWVGTYLDLYFVGKQMYSFPARPYPAIFSINIAFTLIGLPILTTFFLYFIEKMKTWKKGVFIVTISLIMMISEKRSEAIGWFAHNDQWDHLYSFFGYSLFLTIIWKFYRWMSSL
ncbi:CBO0543 family protein [Thermolongibacillus altinsuensis]|uniref:CBO0543 family protein n=1 Tax=Thermolongibacillus altinsuensis TaxID=575256 RepID=UPI00104A056B